MAESKKSDAKKIIDVAQPGKTAPSGNSKSVIISSRPIMKDPMMATESTDTPQKEPVEDLSAKTSKTVVEPNKSEAADKTPTKKEDKKTIAVLAEEAAVKKEETEETADEETTTEAPKSETKHELVLEPTAPVPTEKEDPKPSEDKPADENTEEAKEEKGKSEQERANEADIAEAEIEKHDKEVQKLIDSKKYYLPIKTVEQRRSMHVVIIGVLLSILLLVAWVDISLDSGILQIKSLPHTHVFDHQTTAKVVAVVPVTTYKSFTTSYSKLSIKYPSTWKFTNSVSETSDAFTLTPDLGNDNTDNGNIYVSFNSPIIVSSNATTYTIKKVQYKKLSHEIAGPVYLQDLIFENSTGIIRLSSSLTNSNTYKEGDTITTAISTFLNSDGKSSSQFYIDSIKTDTGKVGFTSVKEAQDFIKTPNYQKARATLLSTTPKK